MSRKRLPQLQVRRATSRQIAMVADASVLQFSRAAELLRWRRLRARVCTAVALAAQPCAARRMPPLWAFACGGDRRLCVVSEAYIADLLRERVPPAGGSVDAGMVDMAATYALDAAGRLCVVG